VSCYSFHEKKSEVHRALCGKCMEFNLSAQNNFVSRQEHTGKSLGRSLIFCESKKKNNVIS
jgi:hypothetical protein